MMDVVIRWLRQLLMLSIATGFALQAGARCQMENVAEIRVQPDRDQLLTQGTIDGHAVQVLIDTGADVSLIWKPAIERLGLNLVNVRRARIYGLGGESYVYSAFVKAFRVGQFAAKNRPFPVAGDLPSTMDFILGEDLLSQASLEFDLRHNAVRTMELTGCTPAQLPYWTTAYSVADLIASPRDALAIRVDVLLNGRKVRARIDSGSSISVISKSVADSVGIHYASAPNGRIVGIGRGSLETWIADVQTFTLGDETIKNTQLRVAEMGKYRTTMRIGSRIPVAVAGEPEMLLGLDFLRAHHIIVDNPMHKVVFSYEGGPIFEAREPREPNGASPTAVRSARP